MQTQAEQLRQPRAATLTVDGKRENPKPVREKLGSANAAIRQWQVAAQKAKHRHNLRRATVQAAARFRELYPAWDEYRFDTHFLLHQGMPIIERHIASPTWSDAIDLALASLEAWPTVSIGQRKRRLLSLTPIAAKLLRLIEMEIMYEYLAELLEIDQVHDALEPTDAWASAKWDGMKRETVGIA